MLRLYSTWDQGKSRNGPRKLSHLIDGYQHAGRKLYLSFAIGKFQRFHNESGKGPHSRHRIEHLPKEMG